MAFIEMLTCEKWLLEFQACRRSAKFIETDRIRWGFKDEPDLSWLCFHERRATWPWPVELIDFIDFYNGTPGAHELGGENILEWTNNSFPIRCGMML